jgi:hypothetical protein
MNKLAVMIDDLGFSQSNLFLIYSLNKLSQSTDTDCCIFHNQWKKPIMPTLFSTFQDNEVWDFNGTVIATNIASAQKLAASPGPKKKYFYVWKFEWMALNNFWHRQIRGIFNNDEIGLIARSRSHFKLLQNLFKEPVAIVEDWNLDQLYKLIK